MHSYDVNIKKLALLFLPPLLRRPGIAAFCYAIVAPLSEIHARFTDFRRETDYRLTHNGQVCYLQALLNDLFDPDERRIQISDTAENPGGLIVYRRELGRAVLLPSRASGNAIMLNRRGYGGVSGYDFVINIPFGLGNINLARLKAVANNYKLASKRFIISYY